MKKAAGVSSKTATSIAGLANVAAGVVAGIGALGAAVLKVTSDVAQMGAGVAKSAQEVGVSAATFQELSHAMGVATGDSDGLKDALLPLSEAIRDAAEGANAKADAFKKLGIEAKNADGTLRDVDSILPELADAFANVADGTEKTAIAQELMGDAGSRLIPLLNEGSAGLAEMRQEAQSLGAVMSGDTLAASKAFEQTTKKLTGQLNGFKTIIGAAVMPIVTKLGEAVLELSGDLFKTGKVQEMATKASKFLSDALLSTLEVLDTLSPVLATVVTGWRMVGNAMQINFNVIQIVAQAIGALAATLAQFVSGALSGFVGGASELADALGQSGLAAQLREGEKAIGGFADKMGDLRSGLFEGMKGDIDDIAGDFGDLEDAVGDLVSGQLEGGLRKSIDTIRGKLEGLGETTLSVGDQMATGFEKATKAAKSNLEVIDELLKRTASLNSLRDVALKYGDAQIASTTTTYKPVDEGEMPGAVPNYMPASPGAGSLGGAASQLLGPLDAFSVAMAAASGGTSVVVQKLAELVASTEGFAAIMGQVSAILDSIFKPVLEGIMTNLAAVTAPFLDIMKELAPVGQAFLMVMQPSIIALKLLAAVIKPVADVIGKFVTAIKKAVNNIRVYVANILRKGENKAYVDADGNIVDPKGKIGAKPGERTKKHADESTESFTSTIEDATYSVKEFKKAADLAQESLTNVPELFRSQFRRNQASQSGFNASANLGSIAGNVTGLSNARPGQAGAVIVEGNVYVVSNDPDEFSRNMQRRNFVATGQPMQSIGATMVFEGV